MDLALSPILFAAERYKDQANLCLQDCNSLLPQQLLIICRISRHNGAIVYPYYSAVMRRHETKLFYANKNGIICGHDIAIIYRRTSTVVYVHNITCATIHNKMTFDWKHRGGKAAQKKTHTTKDFWAWHCTNPYTGTKETYVHGTELTCVFFETCAVWGRCWCNYGGFNMFCLWHLPCWTKNTQESGCYEVEVLAQHTACNPTSLKCFHDTSCPHHQVRFRPLDSAWKKKGENLFFPRASAKGSS